MVGVGVRVQVVVCVVVARVVAVGVGAAFAFGENMSHPLINKTVVALCANYIYCGVLVEAAPDRIVLADPSIVYETGSWSAEKWQDAQFLPTPLIYIERTAVESLFELQRVVQP